jgi:hypothetical protein
VVIALGRGWRPELADLRQAVRDIRPRGGQWVERR